MKIAMLTNNYRPFLGGVPISVERQAHELIALGHEVTVFAPEYGDTKKEDMEAPERVVRYHSQKRKMENGMVYPGIYPGEILKVFAEESFDCIHVHHPMFVGPCALYLGRKYGIPVIYTYHTRYEDYVHYIPCFRVGEHSFIGKKKMVGWIRDKVIPWYMKWFSNHCDLVLAPSAGMRQILRQYGVTARMEVLPTGLADDFFVENEVDDNKKVQKIREKYKKGKKYLFVTVSRLEKEKNYGFLLRGIADIRHRIGDNFQVIILGDGRQKSELKVRASILGIQDVVTFVGSVPNEEVKDYLSASDVFLFASKSETQGIVLAEAMAAGCPVAAVHAVGADDIVKSGVNGYLTDEDEEIWAEAVLRIVGESGSRTEGRNTASGETAEAESRGCLADMRAAALKTAENYSSSALARYEEMLYNQCICEKQNEQRRQQILLEDGKEDVIYDDQENRGKGTAMLIR